MSCETCKDKPDPGTEYEKTKCAKCRLASGVDNPSNHGKTHIDIDALVQNEGDREYAVYEQVQDETINEAVLKLMRGIARMDPVTRNIVCWRIANPSGALQVVANVNSETGPDMPPLVSTKMPRDANALLIAAAPDMLAALKAILPLFQYLPSNESPEEAMVANAIAKAEGVES